MFHARLPQFFGGSVICELESNGCLVLFELSRADFDVEVVALVGDFEDLRPCEAIDAQSEKDKRRLIRNINDFNCAIKLTCRDKPAGQKRKLPA